MSAIMPSPGNNSYSVALIGVGILLIQGVTAEICIALGQ